MSNIRKLVYTAILIAIGVVLPIALHPVPNAGQVLLPMHIPVLLCGFVCGFPYGLACGALLPLTSHLVTGMPPSAMLVPMVCELAVYGLAASALYRLIRTKSRTLNLYASLIGAMLCGRIVYGVLNALIFSAGEYSLPIWLTAMFVTALPGIAVQLILIPAVILLLNRAKLSPLTNR
ncbi:MAG: ECF transporter S component [Oscillospiraceae bacterium]|jgi:niacin transporter|nr:ECF transporter S component [Oscillospiraceae bacterium]